MLVCHISQRPVGRTIAADLAETAEALDLSTLGFIVFATLVDDPASVGEIVDAYLGEIMLEAASANAVADAGLNFNVAITEAGTAADTQDSPSIVALAGFDGTISSDGPIMPSDPSPSLIYVEG